MFEHKHFDLILKNSQGRTSVRRRAVPLAPSLSGGGGLNENRDINIKEKLVPDTNGF